MSTSSNQIYTQNSDISLSEADHSSEKYEMKLNILENHNFYAENIIIGTLAPKKVIYIQIPGNPGYCGFYFENLCMLHKLLLEKGFQEHDIQLSSVSLGGNWVGTPTEKGNLNFYNQDFGLEDQINYLILILRELYFEAYPDCDIYVGGHSIGGYIISQVLNRLTEQEQSRIKQCFLICSTIMELENSPNGKGFWMQAIIYDKLYFSTLIKWIFSGWNTIIPPSIKYSAFRRFHGSTESLDPHIPRIHSSRLLKGSHFLAQSEFKELRELKDEVYQKLPNKFVFIFSDSDMWCTSTHREYIQKALSPYQKEMIVMSVRHAYCIHKEDNLAVANYMSKFFI